jgi:hypothetical protein
MQRSLREKLAKLRTINRILGQWDEHEIAAMSSNDVRGIALLRSMRKELLHQL